MPSETYLHEPTWSLELLLAVTTIAVWLFGSATQTAAQESCPALPRPQVVADSGDGLLQYWLIEDEPRLHGESLPSSSALSEFRERISSTIDTDARTLLEQQLPQVTAGDGGNLRLVLSGEVGSIRPMSCLEALLFATQAERSAGQGRSMYTDPTEFLAYVLRRGSSLKIWFYTVDQPGVRGVGTVHTPVTEDVRSGWVVVKNVHNHNFFPSSEQVLGGVVPSATDVQAARSMLSSIEVPQFVVTNGFDSIEISAVEIDLLNGP